MESTVVTDIVDADLTTLCSNGELCGSQPFYIDPSIIARAQEIFAVIINLVIGCLLPILIFGLVGNSIAFYILFRKARNSTTHLYLSALSFIDCIFLISSVSTWLVNGFSGGSLDLRKILDCNSLAFLLYVTKQISAWLLVIVSIERLLVVYMPTRAHMVTKMPIAYVSLSVMCVVIFIFNWMSFGGYLTNRQEGMTLLDTTCRGRTDFIEKFRNIHYPVIISTFYSYLPSILLFLTNAAIIAKFILAAKQVRIKPDDESAGSQETRKPNESGRTMAKNSRRMTITGVALSVTFLVLTIPSSVMDIYVNWKRSELERDIIRYYMMFMAVQITNVFSHLNHAINFALYCLTSSKFRQDLLAIIKCRQSIRQVGSSIATESTVK